MSLQVYDVREAPTEEYVVLLKSAIKLVYQDAQAILLPERGGLLQSLVLQTPTQVTPELLWQPPAAKISGFDQSGDWPGGGAPWLFPFAGRVFHQGQVGSYELDGQIYQMPIHGFAYSLNWRVRAQRAQQATLLLSSDAKTRQLYPFDFTATAHYELDTSAIHCALHVTAAATNQGPMPLAAGMHPYFRMPLAAPDIGDLTSCLVQLAAGEQIQVTPTGTAGITTVRDQPFRHFLNDPLTHNLILGKLAAPTAQLQDHCAGINIVIKAEPNKAVKYFVLWSKPEAGFYCLEPWMCLPDAVSSKTNCQWLQPGAELRMRVTIGVANQT